MVIVLVEPAGALLQRSLELRGNTLEPYSCEVLASYSAETLARMGCKVNVFCCADDVPQESGNDLKRLEPTRFEPENASHYIGKELDIHVLQHGRKAVEDLELATEINNLLKEGSPPYVVGLSVRTYAYMKSLVLSSILKSWNPDATIVLGGYHPSVACGEDTKKYWEKTDEREKAKDVELLRAVSYQIAGEGEKPFAVLLAKRLGIADETIKSGLALTGKALLQISSLSTVTRSANVLPTVIGGDAWRMSPEEFTAAPAPVRNPHLISNWCRNWNLSYPSPSQQTGVFQVQFTRGCSHSACSFCCTPYVFGNGQQVRHKNPEAVVEEIRKVRALGLEKTGLAPNFVYFNDVTFNSSDDKTPNWRELCRAMIHGGLHTPHSLRSPAAAIEADKPQEGVGSDIDSWLDTTVASLNANEETILNIPEKEDIQKNLHWFALCRGDAISLKDALLLASAGCSKIGVGIESYSDEVAGGQGLVKFNSKAVAHDAEAKASYTKCIETTLKNTDRVGIINRIYIILGSPSETIESLQATWNMLLTLPIDQIRVAFYVPYVTGDDLLENDRTLLTEDEPNIKTPTLTPAVVSLVSRAREVLKDNKKRSDDEPNNIDEDPLRKAIDDVACNDALSPEETVSSFLLAFRKRMIRLFYKSKKYEERVLTKLARYPRLEQSYREFFVELLETSAGKIDIRSILVKHNQEKEGSE